MVSITAQSSGVAANGASLLGRHDPDIQLGHRFQQAVDLVGCIFDLEVEVFPHLIDLARETPEVVGDTLALENRQIANGGIFGLIENVLYGTEETGKRCAQVVIP